MRASMTIEQRGEDVVEAGRQARLFGDVPTDAPESAEGAARYDL